MSLSSSRVGYKHRVTFRRDSGGVDDWGDDSGPAWSDYLVNTRCRAWTNGGQEPVNDDRTVVVEDRRISVALGTAVTEKDQVASVTDRKGRLVFDGPMTIEAVLRHTDHLELVVKRIR